MAVQSGTTSAPVVTSQSSAVSNIYLEGIVAGVIGAAVVAVWFFFIDLLSGRPFYTPNLLGTALFGRGVGLERPEALTISLEMVLLYTWVHGMAFCAVGGLIAKLLILAERNLNIGFGILLFFVIFEFGFLAVAFTFAESILHALAWPAVLIGNILAAGAMGIYFWLHHRDLTIRP